MHRSLVPIAALLSLSWALSGCKDHPAGEPAGPSPEPTSSAPDANFLPFLVGDLPDLLELPSVQLAGEVDVENRYLFTVLIEVQDPSARAGTRMCSGVIIAPGLVLTAGHCVCRQQRTESAQRDFIDGSVCAATAVVTATTYLPAAPGMRLGSRSQLERHEGVIHPHPELKILLDEQGGVASSHADLALIHVDAPLSEHPPVELANTNVELNASLVMVGVGNDESSAALWGRRRFNVTRVISLPPGEDRILLDSPKQPLFANDSGGACLRETPRGRELIGLSSRGLGKTPACTSTYFHRAWLRDELIKAAQKQ